jgi:hypothetical protein
MIEENDELIERLKCDPALMEAVKQAAWKDMGVLRTRKYDKSDKCDPNVPLTTSSKGS